MASEMGSSARMQEWVERSATAVLRRHQEFRADFASPEELAIACGVLCAAINDTADSQAPIPLRPGVARTILGALQGEFLALAAGAQPLPSSRDLIDVMASFEHVRQRLDGAWHDRFADRMAGPDGLDLVVEVAHDLRSPLTSVLFLAETLLRGSSGPLSPLQERQLGLIYSAAFGLSTVANDVVDLVRGGERLMDVDPMPFSILESLEGVRDIVRPIAEEKGLEVRIVQPEYAARLGYPTALNRVLLNLTTNGLKFTDEGSVELSARCLESDVVEFAVRDTGRGIPEQARALLFEPFRRREWNGDYAFSGSGLGLTICRRLVEGMGGELQVETAPGTGTRFHFRLVLPVVATDHASVADAPAVRQ